MNKGNRKELSIRSNQTLELKGYVDIFLHNLGGSSVRFGDYDIAPSQKHTISSSVAVDEDVTIEFSSGGDNLLYVSVISTKCTN